MGGGGKGSNLSSTAAVFRTREPDRKLREGANPDFDFGASLTAQHPGQPIVTKLLPFPSVFIFPSVSFLEPFFLLLVRSTYIPHAISVSRAVYRNTCNQQR